MLASDTNVVIIVPSESSWRHDADRFRVWDTSTGLAHESLKRHAA